ncbi:hypothetical protein H4582DRAFT_871001 [Lactarius indigo]|nr:hypothetical protein H4582DRAFT_871001 [Lactarius indigo]
MCERNKASSMIILQQLHRAIGDNVSVEVAILHLMGDYHFDLERGLNINFSNVKYRDVAPFVGLDRIRHFYDAPSFDLCRSRIPTALFKDVVMEMDVPLFQYGTLRNHNTEETRFLSIQNTQESLMGDCNTGSHIILRRRMSECRCPSNSGM